ncbi:Monocarboxylate transporter 12 (MCT 12) (Solute carrier family 16 member 12) [Durusdinium trenchii]|uniref:Monocarboxylate transporter 12 (MCT 12) (Solute carrier family 16 member 12) n=1 Tax=Durusdinium trenchii TaxID=1381693 RepID=A0ABP0Q4G8_9DINO
MALKWSFALAAGRAEAASLRPQWHDEEHREALWCGICYGQIFASLKAESAGSVSEGAAGARLGTLALIGSARDFLMNTGLMFTGPCVKQCGYVFTAVLGGSLMVVGLLLDSVVPRPLMFLSFSCFSGLGSALLFMPSGVVPFLCFSGPMLPVVVGIASTGGGVGTVVLNILLAHFLDAWGRRSAQRVLALCLLFVLSLNTIALWYSTRQAAEAPEARSESGETASETTQSETEPSETTSSKAEKAEGQCIKSFLEPFSNRSFLLLNVGLLLYMCGFMVPYTHLVYYAEQHGYREAPTLISTIGAAAILGRFFGGLFASVISPSVLFLVVISLQGLSLILLPFCTSGVELHGFSVLFGISSGSRVALLSLLLNELFGVEKVPHYFGLVGAALGIGNLTGPTLVGTIVDMTGSYRAGFWTSASLVLASVPSVLAAIWTNSRQRASEASKGASEV